MTDSVESVLQNSREEFEKWMNVQKIIPDYAVSGVKLLWEAWQASRSALEPMLAELKRQLRSENIVAQNEIKRAEAAEQALREAQERGDDWKQSYITETELFCESEAENEKLRELLRRSQSVIDKLLERRGEHRDQHCYRGSDDGCYCGMAELIAEAEALLREALSPSPTPTPDTNTQSLCRAKPSPDSPTPAPSLMDSAPACMYCGKPVLSDHPGRVCTFCIVNNVAATTGKGEQG